MVNNFQEILQNTESNRHRLGRGKLVFSESCGCDGCFIPFGEDWYKSRGGLDLCRRPCTICDFLPTGMDLEETKDIRSIEDSRCGA